MTAKLKVRKKPVVDTERAAEAAADALVEAMRRALDRAGLVDTGAMREQLEAIVGRDGKVQIRADGDRRIAAAVHQARLQWAKLSEDDRRKVIVSIKRGRRVLRKERRHGVAPG